MIGQYMTPFWAAEALVDAHFAHLTSRDLVLEPTCGTGAFLRALPAHVPAVGVELDPALAARAARETGREVIVGDIRTVPLKLKPTAILGNPPFKASLIHALLERCHELLPVDGAVGFILPAYFMQSAAAVMRLNRRWGIDVQLLARTLYPRLSKPLIWAMFRRGHGVMVGLALYAEAEDLKTMRPEFTALLRDCAGRGWREVVVRAVVELGGEAGLDAIYERVAPRRPSGNPWWREKVRQQCQAALERTAKGRYRVPVPQFSLEAA